MQAILTVLNNPLEGRDAEFNDWYTNVHIRDVMRFGGSIRVQRLVASPIQVEAPSHRYFTIYDTFDPALLSQEHHDAAGTRRMVVKVDYDKPNIINGYYYPLVFRTNDPVCLTPDEQPMILEQIDVPFVRREQLEEWYANTQLPGLLRRPAHVSGTLMRFDPAGQLSQFTPIYSHIAIWRVTDLATAIESWRDGATGPLNGLKRRVSCFEPMAPYLTRDHVYNASDEMLEVEEGARLRAEGKDAPKAKARRSRSKRGATLNASTKEKSDEGRSDH